jgi:hypothetical protein
VLGTSLVRAIERFAKVVQSVSDSELERKWAWGAYDSEGVRFSFFRTYEELCDLAANVTKSRAAHGPSPSSAQLILAQYHEAYRDLQAGLLGTTADEADQEPAEGEWPLRRVVAHIVGAEVGFCVVVKYALDRQRSGDGRSLEIPDEAWDAILGEDVTSIETKLDGSLAGIQAYYEAFHNRVLQEFADIREDELAIPSIYWEGYAMSLRFRLHRFDSHLRQHTVQVDKTLAGIGREPNEARRLLRLIYGALAEAEGATIGAWDIGAELRHAVALRIAARAEEIASILA